MPARCLAPSVSLMDQDGARRCRTSDKMLVDARAWLTRDMPESRTVGARLGWVREHGEEIHCGSQ